MVALRPMERAMAALFLATSLLVVVPAGAQARAVINVPGDYPTIKGAVSAAVDGDMILVEPGVYESFFLSTPNVAVVSTGGPNLTKIDLSIGSGRITALQGADGFTLDGFTVSNATDTAIRGLAFDVTVRNNRIVDANAAFRSLVQLEHNGLVERNLFTNNECGELVRAEGLATVANNLMVGNAFCDGIKVTDETTKVLNNTLVGNGLAIIYTKGSSPFIRNNLVANNFKGIGTDSQAASHPFSIRNNLIWNSPPHTSEPDLAGQNSNIAANPRFTTAEPGLFRYGLKPTSPAIDSGIGANQFTEDFFGGSRVVDGDGDGTAKVDIGAVEFMSGVAAIAGTITYPNGVAAIAACATAWLDGAGPAGAAPANADGTFAITLPPGNYQVRYDGCGSDDLVETWHGGPTRETAATVNVVASQTTENVDGSVGIDAAVTCNGLAVTILGTDRADQITGTAANDVIDARDGHDVVKGGLGRDTACGGDGNDELRGQKGNDTLVGGDGRDEIVGGLGNDTLDGGKARDKLLGDRGNDTILAGAGNDPIWPGPGADSVDGGGGNDTIHTGTGNDGDDSYDGGAGRDWLEHKGATPISINLETGSATGRGSDTVSSIELVFGTPGNDVMVGDAADNTFWGGAGDDNLSGGPGNDLLEGQDGDDVLSGDEGFDDVEGGDGDDVFLWVPGDVEPGLPSGDERFDGSSGIDQFNVAASPQGVQVTGNGFDSATLDGVILEDIETFVGSDFDDNLRNSRNFVEVDLGAGDDSIVTRRIAVVMAGTGNDHVIATYESEVHLGDGDDFVRIWNPEGGFSGISMVWGDAGDDTILGGPHEDWLYGGAGNDTMEGRGDHDTIVGGRGLDEILGGSGSDLILGGPGNDNIGGDNGPDGIIPGAGDDVVDGGNGEDVVSYEDSANPIDANLANGAVTGWGTDTLTSLEILLGSPQADVIVGSSGNDGFNGGEGDDEIRGGDGADLIFGWTGDDLLIGGPGDDDIDGQADTDTANGKAGTDNCVNVEFATSCETSDPIADLALKSLSRLGIPTLLANLPTALAQFVMSTER